MHNCLLLQHIIFIDQMLKKKPCLFYVDCTFEFISNIVAAQCQKPHKLRDITHSEAVHLHLLHYFEGHFQILIRIFIVLRHNAVDCDIVERFTHIINSFHL